MLFRLKRQIILIALFLLLISSVSNYKETQTDRYELYWLAMNIYHEASNQSKLGKIAVGVVTLNRLNRQEYSNTIEGVVKQRKQFSWYNVRKDHTPRDKKTWEECLEIANSLLTIKEKSAIMITLEGVTHYHAKYVKPVWSKSLAKVTQIGDHIFYRKKSIHDRRDRAKDHNIERV